MATVDIKNPEISNVQRYHNNSQVNNIVHSSFPKREKKNKGKKKRLTKADIGTPSNFQWVTAGTHRVGGSVQVTKETWFPFAPEHYSLICLSNCVDNLCEFSTHLWMSPCAVTLKHVHVSIWVILHKLKAITLVMILTWAIHPLTKALMLPDSSLSQYDCDFMQIEIQMQIKHFNIRIYSATATWLEV